MMGTRTRRVATLVAGASAVVMAIGYTSAGAAGGGKTWSTLQSGFTQELVGLVPSFAGGVAFAKDGDPLVDQCGSGGNSTLYRFDLQKKDPVQHGTSTLHPIKVLNPVNVGCGLTNGKNRNLYTNTSPGVVELNPETGATIKGPFQFAASGTDPASNGNVLGITPDPVTGNLVYVGSGGTLLEVNGDLTSHRTFSHALDGKFIDGIFFDPTGKHLFASDRQASAVAIIGRDGKLVQSVSVAPHGQPDGIAFHAGKVGFVVTNNTDGSMSRIDFKNGDPAQAPKVTTFADGGHRGDLTQVGPDGCLYVTQDGVRFDDGSAGEGDALVRVCGGFITPPGAGTTTTTTTVPVTVLASTAAPTTTTPVVVLPRTGSSSTPLTVFGLGALTVGLALTGLRRRPRRV